MTTTPTLLLQPATESDAALLSNLLELYIHDLSDIFTQIELGDNGRFGYPKLAGYWAEPARRFAFLIRWEGRIAGFVLATRGSPVSSDPEVLDVAEFFVLRRYRHAGVGRQAARLLWSRLPGAWTVRVSEANPGALDFWRRAVTEFTSGNAEESTRPGQPSPWRVFSFESASPVSAG